MTDASGRPMYEFGEFFVGDVYPMYVQTWRGPTSPHDGSRNVVFVGGGAHTGVSWTTTPDGRPGWARLFASLGWVAYVVDWPGTGRSRLEPGEPYASNAVLCQRVAELLRQVGPTAVIGHSYGAPIVAKAMDDAPGTVSCFVGVAPSAPGNVRRTEPAAVEGAALWLAPDDTRAGLANASRFPTAAWGDYLRSVISYSPAIRNACGDRDHSGDLIVKEVAALRRVPSLVLLGDEEAMSSVADAEEIAQFLDADFVRLKEDWGLPGFGHMLPIEQGTAAIVDRVTEWMANLACKRPQPHSMR